MNGYGATEHGGKNLAFLLLATCLTCDTVCFYVFMYEEAFAIPNGLERVKRAVVIQVQGISAGSPLPFSWNML